MTDAVFASIATVGARYRDGSLSPIDVTRACLGRIDDHQWIAVDADWEVDAIDL